jgi:hypothetical protein
MIKHLLLSVIAVALCGCGALSTTPKPEKSKYLKAEFGGVMMNTKEAKPFTNNFDFTVSPTTPAKTYATILYQSLDGSSDKAPIKKDGIKPGQKISTSSVSFGRIKNNTNYNVTVQLYSDASRKVLIDTLNQPIRFSMPPHMLDATGMSSRVD